MTKRSEILFASIWSINQSLTGVPILEISQRCAFYISKATNDAATISLKVVPKSCTVLKLSQLPACSRWDPL